MTWSWQAFGSVVQFKMSVDYVTNPESGDVDFPYCDINICVWRYRDDNTDVVSRLSRFVWWNRPPSRLKCWCYVYSELFTLEVVRRGICRCSPLHLVKNVLAATPHEASEGLWLCYLMCWCICFHRLLKFNEKNILLSSRYDTRLIYTP